jgi:hypothetical protein
MSNRRKRRTRFACATAADRREGAAAGFGISAGTRPMKATNGVLQNERAAAALAPRSMTLS